MKLKPLITLCALCAALPFYPAHADSGAQFDFGAPASAAQVTRTIHVSADDNMRLVFDAEDLHYGDVVRFVVSNHGKMKHEFGVADEAGQREHAAEMMHMPDMMHDDPNVIALDPGATRSLIWSFKHVRHGQLVFACNVPGHYAAGMVKRITLKK